MNKQQLSEGYVGEWRRRTKDYRLAPQRNVLILGGNKLNIGGMCAEWMEACGDKVTLLDKPQLDITSEVDLRSFFDVDTNCGFDTLVINAGMTHLDWFEDQTPDRIYRVIDATLAGPMLAANAWVKATMGYQVKKYLVFIGSMAHKAVLNGSAPYCAAKAGIAHLVECLGYELTPKGYRVFGVHPSNTLDGPMTRATLDGLMRYRGLTQEEALEYWNTGLLMPGQLTRMDIAKQVAYLTSGDADYQSGSNIELKGGQR